MIFEYKRAKIMQIMQMSATTEYKYEQGKRFKVAHPIFVVFGPIFACRPIKGIIYSTNGAVHAKTIRTAVRNLVAIEC
jgi:hypothetical protein